VNYYIENDEHCNFKTPYSASGSSVAASPAASASKAATPQLRSARHALEAQSSSVFHTKYVSTNIDSSYTSMPIDDLDDLDELPMPTGQPVRPAAPANRDEKEEKKEKDDKKVSKHRSKQQKK
jgi:hypothetical protein